MFLNKCKKCDSEGTVILRKRDYYCNSCFVVNVNHKFRASIGKNKILSANEKVLICLSGGLGSTVLVDLIKTGISLDNHKKLWITPIFFHAIGQRSTDQDNAKKIIQHCNNYNFDIYLSHISEYVLPNKVNLKINEIPEENNKANMKLESVLNDIQLTSQYDYLAKIRREIYISCAQKLHCNFVFTAETTSSLAVNLLTNLSLGRGSQVQHDIANCADMFQGFCDSRNDINIIRPMKDIIYEELENYIRIKKLPRMEIQVQSVSNNSLHSVIQTFVNDLQTSFPSTIPTICKTAEKIGSEHTKDIGIKCVSCESGIGKQNEKFSALEAISYSKIISTAQNSNLTESQNKETPFPYVNEYFCYACSKNYREMDKNKIQNNLIDFPVNK